MFSEQFYVDFLAKSMGVYWGPYSEQLLDEVSVVGIARYLASDKCSKIAILAGAGISTGEFASLFRSITSKLRL